MPKNKPPVQEPSQETLPEPSLDDDILDLLEVVKPGKPMSREEAKPADDFAAGLDAMLEDLAQNEQQPFADPTPVDYDVDMDEKLAMPSMGDLDDLLESLGAKPEEPSGRPAPSATGDALDAPAEPADIPEFSEDIAETINSRHNRDGVAAALNSALEALDQPGEEASPEPDTAAEPGNQADDDLLNELLVQAKPEASSKTPLDDDLLNELLAQTKTPPPASPPAPQPSELPDTLPGELPDELPAGLPDELPTQAQTEASPPAPEDDLLNELLAQTKPEPSSKTPLDDDLLDELLAQATPPAPAEKPENAPPESQMPDLPAEVPLASPLGDIPLDYDDLPIPQARPAAPAKEALSPGDIQPEELLPEASLTDAPPHPDDLPEEEPVDEGAPEEAAEPEETTEPEEIPEPEEATEPEETAEPEEADAPDEPAEPAAPEAVPLAEPPLPPAAVEDEVPSPSALEDVDLNELDALIDGMLASAPAPGGMPLAPEPQPLPAPELSAGALKRLDELEKLLKAPPQRIDLLEELTKTQAARIDELETLLKAQAARVDEFEHNLEKLAAAAAARVIREEIVALLAADGVK